MPVAAIDGQGRLVGHGPVHHELGPLDGGAVLHHERGIHRGLQGVVTVGTIGNAQQQAVAEDVNRERIHLAHTGAEHLAVVYHLAHRLAHVVLDHARGNAEGPHQGHGKQGHQRQVCDEYVLHHLHANVIMPPQKYNFLP